MSHLTVWAMVVTVLEVLNPGIWKDQFMAIVVVGLWCVLDDLYWAKIKSK